MSAIKAVTPDFNLMVLCNSHVLKDVLSVAETFGLNALDHQSSLKPKEGSPMAIVVLDSGEVELDILTIRNLYSNLEEKYGSGSVIFQGKENSGNAFPMMQVYVH